MRRAIKVMMILTGISVIISCSNSEDLNKKSRDHGKNKVVQQADGSIELHVKKAECYSDKINPSTNTAEWDVIVSRSGRFNVWLTSATTDTTNLSYSNKVLLSVHDNVLEAQPVVDKVIKNCTEVDYPFFRADSFMGSLYIQDTGLYAVQIISDKIVPEGVTEIPGSDKTQLLSVFLTPVVQ